jgi:D-amino-acid dehydrogenase
MQAMPENATNQTDVIVLGAGIVGVSSAYAARQRGMSVVLVDRREPGSETSYGNAGIISSGSIFPLNQPSLFGNLPKYLSNRHPALRWDVGWVLKNPGWIARFLASARASQTKPRALALHGLIKASLKLHREWIVQAGAGNRIRETGWLKAWRSDNVAAAKADQERAARPPGHFRTRAEHPARLQRRPPAQRNRVGGFAGQRHQGLREDACRRRRRDPPCRDQVDRTRQ